MIGDTESGQRDPLTGTATLDALLRYAAAALDLTAEDGPRVAMLCLDIEGLGVVNGRHGEPAGDAVLLGVADRLRDSLRAHDLVGRMGGGFAICLPEIFGTQAAGTAERLRKAVSAQPIPTPAGPVPVACSIGVAVADLTERVGALLERARAAAAVAKSAGGDRISSAP